MILIKPHHPGRHPDPVRCSTTSYTTPPCAGLGGGGRGLHDFAGEEPRAWACQAIKQNKRLLVLPLMTKFFCIAGLRLGYALAVRRHPSATSPPMATLVGEHPGPGRRCFLPGSARLRPQDPRPWPAGARAGHGPWPSWPDLPAQRGQTTCCAACPPRAPLPPRWRRPRLSRGCWCATPPPSWAATTITCGWR